MANEITQFGLAPEPLEGDSLTQYLRALFNYLQGQGAGSLAQGRGTTGQAIQGVGQAGQTLQPGIDYWTRLLSGDTGETVRALAPEASTINSQYTQAQRAASMLPRGGFASATQANLPFAAARDIGNSALALRPQAAQGVLAGGQAQGGLAQLLALIGQGQSSLGAGLLGQASQGQLERRGQNVGEHGQMLNFAGQALGDLTGLMRARIGAP